jgi:hypothetical protein
VQQALHLYRADFALQTQTGLRFPRADGGFKGSAWHGRIDHVIRRHPALSSLLRDEGRSGAASPYWIEAPEDSPEGDEGPFGQTAYLPGLSFSLSIFVAGRPLDGPLRDGLTEAVQRAGMVDPARLTDERSASMRLSGSFRAVATGVKAFALSDLQPARITTPHAALAMRFVTMLRLDDGESLKQAQERLRDGGMWVPRLHVLASKVLDRCQSLGLGCEAPWLMPALHDAVSLLKAHAEDVTVRQASVYPCDFSRISARAQRRDPQGGLIGQAVYEAPSNLISQAFPLFKLAEWIRIGRKTGLGAGRIQVSLRP